MIVPATTTAPRTCPELPPAVIDVLRFPSRPLNQGTLAAVNRAVNALDEYLMPAPRPWVLARVATLLAHYWTPEMPANLQQAVARDWGNVLEEFPSHAIERAARDWLETETSKKPTPGAVRDLVLERIGHAIKRRDKLRDIASRAVRGPSEDYSRDRKRTPEEMEAGLKMFAQVKAILNETTEGMKS